jgi:TonB family protein
VTRGKIQTMKNETSSLRKTLALAASLIFHSSALLILAAMPLSSPVQKAGDIVTVDIQDKSAQGAVATLPEPPSTISPANPEMPALPAQTPPAAVVHQAPPVIAKPEAKPAVVKAPKVIVMPVAKATPKVSSKPAAKVATDLPAKVSDSKSTALVAMNEVENSPETAQDVDADAAALMASAKEQAEPMPAPAPVATVEKTVEKTVENPVEKAVAVVAPQPQPTAAVSHPNLGEGAAAPKPATGANDGASSSHGSPEGMPAGVVSDAQLGLPIYSVKPYYPSVDKVRGFQGETDLVYTVGSNGAVSNVRVWKSSGSTAMDQSAMKALSYFRYQPQSADVEVMKKFAYRLSGTAQEMPARLRQAGVQSNVPKK